MQPLSAIDAISPAWQHTRDLLFAPRRWQLLLKIGAVACFAQVGGCNLRGNVPGNLSQGATDPGTLPFHTNWMILGAVAGVVLLLFALVFFYVGSRLQFVLFDVVLRRETSIGPLWQRYRQATWRWMGLQTLYFVLALACVAPLMVPAIIQLVGVLHLRSGEVAMPANSGSLLGVFLGLMAAVLVAALVLSIGQALLHDFGLPSMALEGTSVRETASRVFRLIRNEPLQVLLFLVMRVLLLLVCGIAVEIALLVGILILLIPLGGLAAILYTTLHHAALGGKIAMIAGWVVLGVIFLALLFVGYCMLFGYILTFIQAYAIYFLAGRYPLMAEILQPVPPPPPFGYPYPPPLPGGFSRPPPSSYSAPGS